MRTFFFLLQLTPGWLIFSSIFLASLAAVIYLILSRKSVNRETMLWTIATAIKHDMPLPELIRAQARESWGSRKRILFEMASDLSGGASLPDVVDTYRLLIPEQGRLAIHVGSESGTLDQSLDAALEHLERRPQKIIRDFQAIFFYLGCVLTAWMGIAGFVMYWIIPKFKNIFVGFGVELPGITITLINFSDFVVNYFYLIPGVVIILLPLGAFITSLMTGGMEIPDKAYAPLDQLLHRSIFNIDWVITGPVMRLSVRLSPQRASADILRYLGVVAQANQPMLGAIDTLSQHHKAKDIRNKLHSVKERLKQGGVLWEALAAKGFLSKQKAALLHTAEVAGDLPYALKEKSQQFEKEHQHRMICFMEYTRVTAILMLCFMTGFFAISLFMPLIQLMNDLS